MVLANLKSVLLYSILYYIWLCPYSKVEESFNIQASHDLLRYGDLLLFNDHRQQPTLNAKIAFDHLEFPGVVPRTFLGPIFLAAVSWPAHIIFHFLNLPLSCSQLIVRSSLGIISWYAFTEFSDAVSIRFGHRAGSLTNLLAALQFHMPFYMSRTLPNTFALIICLIAYSLWLRGRALSTLLLVAWAMMIFRCDLLLVIAPLTLQLLISKEVSFWRTATRGIFTSVVALALSVSVDSYFWHRWDEKCIWNMVEQNSITPRPTYSMQLSTTDDDGR